MLVVPSTSLTGPVSSVRSPMVRTTTKRIQAGGHHWYTTPSPISRMAYIPSAYVSREYRPSARRPTPSSSGPVPRSTTIKPRFHYVQYPTRTTVSPVPSTTTRPFLSTVPYPSTNSTVFRNLTVPQTSTPAAVNFSAYDEIAVGAPALPDCPEPPVQPSSHGIM